LSCCPAAVSTRAAVTESGPMKLSRRSSILALPVRTYFSTSAGISFKV
jgi:hypothetical protein